MTWQERDDVYKPTPIEAHAFVQTLGMPRPPEIQPRLTYIFIRKTVHDQIRTHLKRDVRVELGGLLFGRAYFDESLDSYLILVEVALPAIGAQELPHSLTYTPEAWHRLTPQMQQLDPGDTLIGSYHSHPGMGVFLSGTDLNTQADVFIHDWQIALVMDPVADETGFFAGKSGEPCPEWYLLSADRTAAATPAQCPQTAS
jgi:proteasome lid subunit RPN8/RPN11